MTRLLGPRPEILATRESRGDSHRPSGSVPWSVRVVLLLGILLRGWWLHAAVLAVFPAPILLVGGRAFIDTFAAVAVVMSFAGVFVGVGAANLRNWPGATLVPGYLHGLFAATLFILGIAWSAWAAVCVLAGNPVPFLGPGLLVGLVVALCVVPLRHYAQFFAGLIFLMPVLVTGSALALGTRVGWYDANHELLAKPWVQVVAFAAAGMVLWMLWWIIRSPIRAGPTRPPATGSIPVQPSGLPAAPASDRLPIGWVTVLWGSAALVGLALLLRLSDPAPFWSTMGFLFPWGILAHYGGVYQLHHVHAVVHFLWFVDVAGSRADLARRGATTILLRAFAWLPAGLAGAAILALGSEYEGAFLQTLLIVQTFVLIMVSVCLVRVRRLPIGFTRLQWLYSQSGAFVGMLILSCWWGQQELAAVGYSVPILAVVWSAGIAALLAARTLSRAEVIV